MKANPYKWINQSREHADYASQGYPLISSLASRANGYPAYSKLVQAMPSSYMNVYMTEWNNWFEEFGKSWDKLGCVNETSLGQYTDKHRWSGASDFDRGRGTTPLLGQGGLAYQQSSAPHFGGLVDEAGEWWEDFGDAWGEAKLCEVPYSTNATALIAGPPSDYTWYNPWNAGVMDEVQMTYPCGDWHYTTWQTWKYMGERYRNEVTGEILWTLDLGAGTPEEYEAAKQEFFADTGVTILQPKKESVDIPAPPIPDILVDPEIPPIIIDDGNGGTPAPVGEPWYKKVPWPVVGVVGGLALFAGVMMTSKKRGRRR